MARRPEQTVNDLIDQASEEIDDLVDDLEDGELDADEWREETANRLRWLYLVLVLLALRVVVLTDEVRRELEGRLRQQLDYLERFADEIERGLLTIGQIRRRAAMYVNSSRQAYWAIRKIQEIERGMTEERWITLGDERVCTPCTEAERMGWMPIGTFGEPGSGVVLLNPPEMCLGLTNCRCELDFR